MDVGNGCVITDVQYDGKDIVYNAAVEQNRVDLEALGKDSDLLKASISSMFKNADDEVKELFQTMIDADAGLKYIYRYKGETDGVKISCRLSPEELEALINGEQSEEASYEEQLSNVVKTTNLSCPMQVDEYTVLTETMIEEDNMVYCYKFDEGALSIEALREQKASLRESLHASFDMQDEAVCLLLDICRKCGKGICYRYIGGTTGESMNITFTPSDLGKLLKQ